MKKVFALVFTCLFFMCKAQDDKSVQLTLDSIIQKIIQEGYKPYSIVKELHLENKPEILLPLLEEYKTIPNAIIQENVYKCYYEYGMNSTYIQVKKQMIEALLDACSDSVQLSYACNYSLHHLMNFNNYLFSDEITSIINERAMRTDNNSIGYSFLSGKLYQTKMIPIFEQKILQTQEPEILYALHAILARLGEVKSVNIVAKSLKRKTIQERVINERNTFLYVKQKEVTDILFADLSSIEKEDPYYESWMNTPPKDGFAYSKRALDIITEIVECFPIQSKYILDYTDEDVSIARQWYRDHEKSYKYKPD